MNTLHCTSILSVMLKSFLTLRRWLISVMMMMMMMVMIWFNMSEGLVQCLGHFIILFA